MAAEKLSDDFILSFFSCVSLKNNNRTSPRGLRQETPSKEIDFLMESAEQQLTASQRKDHHRKFITTRSLRIQDMFWCPLPPSLYPCSSSCFFSSNRRYCLVCRPRPTELWEQEYEKVPSSLCGWPSSVSVSTPPHCTRNVWKVPIVNPRDSALSIECNARRKFSAAERQFMSHVSKGRSNRVLCTSTSSPTTATTDGRMCCCSNEATTRRPIPRVSAWFLN